MLMTLAVTAFPSNAIPYTRSAFFTCVASFERDTLSACGLSVCDSSVRDSLTDAVSRHALKVNPTHNRQATTSLRRMRCSRCIFSIACPRSSAVVNHNFQECQCHNRAVTPGPEDILTTMLRARVGLPGNVDTLVVKKVPGVIKCQSIDNSQQALCALFRAQCS